jgi:hypothetical protein
VKIIHSEIEYTNSEGNLVHSDTCPPECNFDNIDNTYRKFLHDCLDEWLDKSNGTGQFYISEENE